MNVLVERDRGVHARTRRDTAAATRHAARGVCKIDEQIFELGGPVRPDGVFDADARGPAGLCRAAEGERARGGLDVGEGGAAGAVEQHAIPRPAGTAAHSREPIALGGAADARARCIEGGAAEIRPVAVAFDAQHPRPDLVIEAHGAADQRAADGEIAGRSVNGIGPVAIAEGAAAVDAEIEAGPVVNRNDLEVGRRSWRRQIGRECLRGML